MRASFRFWACCTREICNFSSQLPWIESTSLDSSQLLRVVAKRIIQRKRRTFAVTVQPTWFTAILKHPYEVVKMLRETSESVIVFKMHLTGHLVSQLGRLLKSLKALLKKALLKKGIFQFRPLSSIGRFQPMYWFAEIFF